MLDRVYWREDILSSLVYFKLGKTELRERAICYLQLNEINKALQEIKKLKKYKKTYFRTHAKTIKEAPVKWKLHIDLNKNPFE